MLLKQFTGLGCVAAGWGLIVYPALTADAIQKGLGLCTTVLLPSLFPFMILAGFATLSPAGEVISLLMRPFTRLLGVPHAVGSLLLASFVGGFPTGASVLGVMVKQRQISREDAARLLPILINAGPAFAVTAVGERLLGSRRLGWLLLLAQITSSLLLGVFLLRRSQAIQVQKRPALGYGAALVTAVNHAVSGMLSIWAFVLLFSVIAAMLDAFIVQRALVAWITGLLEVTNGCALVAAWDNALKGPAIGFMLGFSGISVLCQVSMLCYSAEISTMGLLRYRFIAGLACAGLFGLFARILGGSSVVAMAQRQLPLAIYSPNRLLCAACLMGMSAILLSGNSLASSNFLTE